MTNDDPIDRVLRMFKERGAAAYLGEPVSQTEHALQTAWAAELAGASGSLIVAALLHDVGHLLHELPEDCAAAGIDDSHEVLAARWLARHFGPDVAEPVRLHVDAKRFLCSTDPAYLGTLSEASLQSLKLQGGPFAPDEAARFKNQPHAGAAIAPCASTTRPRLRDWRHPGWNTFAPTWRLPVPRDALRVRLVIFDWAGTTVDPGSRAPWFRLSARLPTAAWRSRRKRRAVRWACTRRTTSARCCNSPR